MANKITEPRVDQANLDDWSNFIARTTRQGGGFMCITLNNIDNAGVPSIAAGSRFELNGAFYEAVKENGETISGGLVSGSVNYIYAIPSNGNCTFRYSISSPVWSADKGGWYSGNSRAIAKLYFVNGNYNGKVILDSFNAMRMVNTEQPFPLDASGNPTGGSAIVNKESAPVYQEQITLAAGAYRYSIKGGDGGEGGKGSGGYRGGSDGEKGEAGEVLTGNFFWKGGPIRISVGQNGNQGQSGDDDCRNGGGGGAGGCSSIEGVATAAGGLYGDGGANGYTYNDGRERGEAGHPARGPYGGVGGAAGRWFIVNEGNINIKETSRPSWSISYLSSAVGYVRIWRLW